MVVDAFVVVVVEASANQLPQQAKKLIILDHLAYNVLQNL